MGDLSHPACVAFFHDNSCFDHCMVLSEKGFFDGFSFAASYRMATSSAGERSISNWLSIAVFAERIPTFAMGLVIDDCGQGTIGFSFLVVKCPHIYIFLSTHQKFAFVFR